MSDIWAVIFELFAHFSDVLLVVVTVEQFDASLSSHGLKVTTKRKNDIR